jgi:hypothetical protein
MFSFTLKESVGFLLKKAMELAASTILSLAFIL